MIHVLKISLTKHLAAAEIIVLFKGRVNFKQYIPKKHKWFGIKLYKLCDSKGYTYNMSMYFGKGRKCATFSMTATYARIDNVEHKLFMDNFFSSPASFDDSHTKTIYCCGTVRPNRKGMLKNFGHKMKLKKGELKTKMKGNLTGTVWKDNKI